jgi:hypothetical protein
MVLPIMVFGSMHPWYLFGKHILLLGEQKWHQTKQAGRAVLLHAHVCPGYPEIFNGFAQFFHILFYLMLYSLNTDSIRMKKHLEASFQLLAYRCCAFSCDFFFKYNSQFVFKYVPTVEEGMLYICNTKAFTC